MNYTINKEDERAALITRKLIAGEQVKKNILKIYLNLGRIFVNPF